MVLHITYMYCILPINSHVLFHAPIGPPFHIRVHNVFYSILNPITSLVIHENIPKYLRIFSLFFYDF